MVNPEPKSDPAAPKVSFVSLGCPKALVDSERIVTRLRAEGYELSREHKGSDLVIVNTCGFLDSAKAESLAAIGSALKENGKVIVTGCMSIKAVVGHLVLLLQLGSLVALMNEEMLVRASVVKDIMSDAIAVDGAVLKVDDVEARLARRLGEIDHADGVANPQPVRVERSFGALEQLRVDACERCRNDRGLRRGRQGRERVDAGVIERKGARQDL